MSRAIDSTDELNAVISRHWGFSRLRPMQAEAMQAVVAGRDSVLVLPTGGGKSLCYQAPAAASRRTTLVVSPLISLMKDQVDALSANGVAAAALNSALALDEARQVERRLLGGEIRLLYVSPERLAMPGFRRMLQEIDVRTFAIDEAHCISHWGHDFRPEYRQLAELRREFPEASLHAFTATATRQVQADIAAQLRLREPAILVGDFDRPNLSYRVERRGDVLEQTLAVLKQHRTGQSDGEAGIIYCIRRRDVDDLVLMLKSAGIDAMPYHAGLSPQARKKTQDAFSTERCDLVVATVAFGMGIDRSNVRFVLHTGMPKSIEHYQQETGRAGRDGLEAECILLYSGADAMLWRNLLEKSAAEAAGPVDPDYMRTARRHIDDMENFCRPTRCRHASLVEYFDQAYTRESCDACDVCLGDHTPVPDAQTVARKILSCVARLDQRFGANYVAKVLRGERDETLLRRSHDQLSTFGLLAGHPVTQLRDWINQLIAQHLLVRETDDDDAFPVLKLNDASWEVMRNERVARLMIVPEPKRKRKGRRGETYESSSSGATRPSRSAKAFEISWAGVDRELFEALRAMRRDLANERGVPPFVVFGDATLREAARQRPGALGGLLQVYGIGQAKFEQFGQALWSTLDDFCRQHRLSRDCDPPAKNAAALGDGECDDDGVGRGIGRSRPNASKARAMELFAENASLDDIVLATGRAYSTVTEYLCEYIAEKRLADISPWVAREEFVRVIRAAEVHGSVVMKPIFEALASEPAGEIAYDKIRIVLTFLATQQ
jgi:ATP-dependent DNA helicase RecQ